MARPREDEQRGQLDLCRGPYHLGRGRSEDTGESREDYSRRCEAAEHALVMADANNLADAIRRITAGSSVILVANAIRRLAGAMSTPMSLGAA
jgi:hypothetical protein